MTAAPVEVAMVNGLARLGAALMALVVLCAGQAPVVTGLTGGMAPDPPTDQVEYVLPISAPVVDLFRPPSTPWGPGNRGWEFASTQGEPVVAVGPGVVRFAGPVAGRGVLTVLHPGGLLSSLTGLQEVTVSVGETVGAGSPVGTAQAGLHLGFRFEGDYIDPALIYGSAIHAVLVPLPR